MNRIICLLFFIFIFQCQTSKVNTPKEKVPILFQVSDEHKSFFVDLNKNDYSEAEISEIFQNRKELARTVCEMVYGQKKYSKDIVTQFISAESFTKEPFKTWGHPVPKLIAGCWNFFKLNDVHPNRDFALLAKLYPNEPKDCFTVGFMQAYLMHNTLGCKTLTMLDFDWKILEGHKQLLDIFHAKGFDSEEKIPNSLSLLKLGWIARFDNRPMEAETKTDLNSLCFFEHHKMCKEILLNFQKNMLSLDTVYLRLSALHDSNFKTPNNYTKIIYLSNAIDDIYTKRAQFDSMIAETAKLFVPGQKAVFVHHAAGRSLFGIYELKKVDTGTEITTICKDKYLTTPVEEVTSEYSTHFEKVTINKKFPTCEAMLK
ncbi:MAG: hypothetical protein IPL26_24960 [Leptospiraceae bacterium]|nr:hypothetical protein [Leptospiraceae bacterium]